MSVTGGPDIVQDGLVLLVDAGNPRSYVSGSAVWNDASGNQNTGTISGSILFSSGSNGSLVFNNNGDVQFSYNADTFQLGTGDFTFECWYYHSNTTQFQRLFSNGTYLSTGCFQIESPGSAGVNILVHVNATYRSFTFTHTLNAWRHLVATRNSGVVNVYVNGNFIGTQASALNGNINNTTAPTIGSETSTGNFFRGGMAKLALHKGKALSPREILQNFNAQRSRFGV